MDRSSDVYDLLERVTAILPASDDELIYKGIAAGVSDRPAALKRAEARLRRKHGSLQALEHRIQAEGVSPDDHTLYTDLLEWRAIQHEVAGLLHILETL